MQLPDNHVHTFRCGHAGGVSRDFVRRAIEVGLAEIAFTDHIPLYFLPPDARDSSLAKRDYFESASARGLVVVSHDGRSPAGQLPQVEEFIRKPPAGVDVLLLEGTNLRQEGDPKSGKTEQEIENDLIHTFTVTSGIVLAIYSAQNIDRLVTMFRACIQSGRHLVLDL